MPGCASVGCSNAARKGFLMKRFPRDPIRRNEWLVKMQRDKWSPKDSSRLCEVHFAPEMWEKPRVDGKRKLKLCAVPTIFSFSPVESKRKVATKKKSQTLLQSLSEEEFQSQPNTSAETNQLRVPIGALEINLDEPQENDSPSPTLTMSEQPVHHSTAQRIIIKFLAREGVKATEIFLRLTAQFGDETLSRTRIFAWHKEFKEGRERVENEKHDRRPRTSVTDENIRAVRDILKDNRPVRVSDIAEQVGISYGSCQGIIAKELHLRQKKPSVKSSDSTNGTSNRNRNARKRRLKLPTESDSEPEDQSVDDVDEEFVLFGKHVASKLNQMPIYNALQCQEKIEALINDELLIVQSRQEEIDTRLIKQEPEISDEFCDENNIMKKIKQEPSMIDEGRLLVQSCQNEIETVIIKQEPGISDELCDENNTPTLLNQVPASPFSLCSIKTENIPDTELQ